MNNGIIKRALMRFVRGFVSGAISAMIIIVPVSTESWSDFSTWLGALTLAGAFGGISGALLALDKFIRDSLSEGKN